MSSKKPAPASAKRRPPQFRRTEENTIVSSSKKPAPIWQRKQKPKPSSLFFSFFPKIPCKVMALSLYSWLKEFKEASKLADDITGMISERRSLPSSGSDTQRHASAIRRKITMLGTKLDSLESLLPKLPTKPPKMLSRENHTSTTSTPPAAAEAQEPHLYQQSHEGNNNVPDRMEFLSLGALMKSCPLKTLDYFNPMGWVLSSESSVGGMLSKLDYCS